MGGSYCKEDHKTCPKRINGACLYPIDKDCESKHVAFLFCNFCKRDIQPEEDHCSICGRSVEAATTTFPPEEKNWKEMSTQERKQYRIDWVNGFIGGKVERFGDGVQKLKKYMTPNQKKLFNLQVFFCTFGFHGSFWKKSYLMWGNSKRDGVYMSCAFCHHIGKKIEGEDIMKGMSGKG